MTASVCRVVPNDFHQPHELRLGCSNQCDRFYNSGGTNWQPALKAVVECIEKQQHLKCADIVIITDGKCDVQVQFVKFLAVKKQLLEFTVYGILIGGDGEHKLKKIGDRIWVVKDKREE